MRNGSISFSTFAELCRWAAQKGNNLEMNHSDFKFEYCAGYSNQLTDSNPLIKHINISLGGIGRLIYASSWVKFIETKLNDSYLNWSHVSQLLTKFEFIIL